MTSEVTNTRRIKTKGRPFHSNKGKPFKKAGITEKHQALFKYTESLVLKHPKIQPRKHAPCAECMHFGMEVSAVERLAQTQRKESDDLTGR